eukprot:TRINITY_DN57652_c0_g1_i1.p1 TRINITY_DN57652_c0_g1~~TRINITY_DN57652_c0_g1_i1.p1  ORF type:complete len:720 (+),score=206.23 TRINITY_DN57652_c0_g1_i1:47-2161(+)
MKSAGMNAVLVACLLALALRAGATKSRGGNPVQNVVKMLQELQAKVEKEGDAEENLYEKYKCWATKSNDEKDKAIEASEAEIQRQNAKTLELENTVASQKLALKTLNDKIGEVNTSIKEATAAREAEKRANEADLNATLTSIDGLEDAEDVLNGTKAKTSLLSLRGGKRSLLRKRRSTRAALEVTQKYLSGGDAVFMQALLTSRVVPAQDQKAMNQAAQSSDPTARTNKVVRILDTMESKLAANANATKQEEIKDAATFLKMMSEKQEQLSLLKKQISTIEKEQAQRAVEIGEAKDRVEELKDLIGKDKAFIKTTTAALETKTGEWEDRSKVRQDELTALSGAVALLNDPEQTSVISSAYSTADSFLQEASVVHSERRLAVSQALHQAGRAAHDSRVIALATSMASEASFRNFSVVFSKIDSMIQVLNEENSSDTAKKAGCESNLTADLRATKKTQSDISDLDNGIDKLNGEMKGLDTDMAEKEDEIKAAQEELAKAKENRDAENAEYLSNKKDDEIAMNLLDQAIKVLTGFYKGSSKVQSLLQGPAGAPETFSDDYSGSSADGNKIIATMGEAKADLKKDMDKADTCEKNAETMYNDAKKSLEGQITTLRTEIDGGEGAKEGLKGQKAGKKEDKVEKSKDKATKMDELEAIEKRMEDAKPFCDFIIHKFDERLKSRVKELEGLNKAKEILHKYEPASVTKTQG